MRNIWFQQDGATPHTAKEAMAMLRATFPGCLISRFGTVSWPPRSPNFTPPDFIQWRYLKRKVFIEEINRITADI